MKFLRSLIKCLYIVIIELRVVRHVKIMNIHSLEDTLHAISDVKSLDMFCSIAKGSVKSEVLKQSKGLSRKQYYSRAKQLLNVGLIKKERVVFRLRVLELLYTMLSSSLKLESRITGS